MGLFNFGKPKDEVLEAKLKKLNSEIEFKKLELENLKKEIKIGKDLISLDVELARKKKELASLNNQLSIANDYINLQ